MNSADILDIALRQSAIDSHCRPEDFLCGRPVVTASAADARARRYLTLPFDCDLVSYGPNVVASVRPDLPGLTDLVRDYVNRFSPEHCFETPALHVLDDGLRPYGLRVCFMAEYFLPEPDRLQALPCRYPLRVLAPPDLAGLYQKPWSNALCAQRKELDVLAVGAYDGEQLVGLAGASADGEEMWQIGVDVLPAFRRQGLASAMTSRLALEIFEREKVPFYCAAWSNIPSVRNALRCGFRPGWVELTAKSAAFVEELNRT